MPHPSFAALALERGATFAVGSDGHRVVGNLAWPLALPERCGIPNERLFRADRDGRGARRDGRAERAAGAA